MLKLPSLADLDHACQMRIFLCVNSVDMRQGFDRLASLAQTVCQQDPFSGHLFLFRSRRGDRLKILYWDRDGFALWYKRLEEGVFRFPKIRGDMTSLVLKPTELAMLLEGIDLRSVKKAKRYTRPINPELST